MNGRIITISVMVSGLILAITSLLFQPCPRLIWNRSASAPEGLYWRDSHPPKLGDWVIVSPKAAIAIWAETHRLTGKDWPLIKHVAAHGGDKVCRKDSRIIINERETATALIHTSSGTKLPEWSGCFVLTDDQIFLLNDHPASLDGRYFGPTFLAQVEGPARLVWRYP